ncbi:MAG: redoxin family protein [Bacteroidota bacterium]
MRQIFMIILGLAAGVAGAQKLPPILELGASLPLPELELSDATREDDAAKTLASVATERGLLVVFTSNTCPFVVGNGPKSEGWEGRYRDLSAFARKLNVGIVFVNSNEAKRNAGESIEEMRVRAKTYKYQAPYLLDEGHKLADAFGARTTPHVFLFDATQSLVYLGAIDDNVDSAKKVKKAWLKDALTAMVAKQPIKVPQTKNLGCSIKRIQ